MSNKNRRYALTNLPQAMVHSLTSDFENNKAMPSEVLTLRKVES
jgi:hypothetical protein